MEVELPRYWRGRIYGHNPLLGVAKNLIASPPQYTFQTFPLRKLGKAHSGGLSGS